MIMCKTYTKEDFDEDCPRFIPMKYESEIYENGESLSWYIFDTEKLDFMGDIVPYYDYQEAEKVCNIFNGVSYIFQEKIFTSIEKEIARNEKTIEWKKETLDLLNELHDENKQLKQQNEFLKKRCDEYWEESGLNNDYFE